MRQRIAIGHEDFVAMRRAGDAYADRTDAIAELLASRTQVSVICRPRRFGKSLLLHTLRAFLEKGGDHSELFADLHIWRDSEARAHFSRYPVIHLSLKGLIGATFAGALKAMGAAVQAECLRLAARWPGLGATFPESWARLQAAAPEEDDLRALLLHLSTGLHQLSGEPVVVLIDEYDTPLHRAAAQGHYEQMLQLVRDMLDLGLKGNPALAFAVVTGVLRVSREGLWSSFNHPRVYSVLDRQLASICGFTEADVALLHQRTGATVSLEELRSWYNGYSIGGQTIYNPWSVLHALQSGELRPWWAGSGSPDTLAQLLRLADPHTHQRLLAWMAGQEQSVDLRDNLLLREDRPEDVIPLLLHGGYLSPVAAARPSARGAIALRVPNLDVLSALTEVGARWLEQGQIGRRLQEQLRDSLLSGSPEFEALFNQLLAQASAHDFPYGDHERGYHVFLLGLLAWLRPDYQILSNAESGLGRADLLLLPSKEGDPGVIIELKRVRSAREAPAALQAALQQALGRRYQQRLLDCGHRPLIFWGIALWGRQCRAQAQIEAVNKL